MKKNKVSIKKHPFFGMYKDEKQSAVEQMEALRGGRR